MLEEFMAENDLFIRHIIRPQRLIWQWLHPPLPPNVPGLPTVICAASTITYILRLSSNFNGNVNTSFNFQKAEWNRFQDLCRLSLDDYVADIEQFTSKLLDAANSSIPFHKGTKCKTRAPWFTQECRQALRERKKNQKKYFKAPSIESFIINKKQKAKAKVVIKNSKNSLCYLTHLLHHLLLFRLKYFL
ncbi:RNA-directed DNA polymerase from mobile element jockey-like [Plakobranchus ocellatus]|uniref:RNA-directed DNA polymerase from mobile element jockey-like n=1 Tax=Plakobranchus ocellatus TaxID=259542 RepID=A0AAV4B435_9GAST|nr:RNA-directed DNA polymerase from mobile element jockey-like [Plakobranchus ocellatus]